MRACPPKPHIIHSITLPPVGTWQSLPLRIPTTSPVFLHPSHSRLSVCNPLGIRMSLGERQQLADKVRLDWSMTIWIASRDASIGEFLTSMSLSSLARS